MPDPLVVRVIRQFKADLLASERSQMREMARRWRTMEVQLTGAIDALAKDVFDLQQQGPVPVSRIIKLQRYTAFFAQAQAENRKYVAYADDLIAKRQAEWGAQGVFNAVDAIKAAYADRGRITIGFNMLPVNAIETMVGLAGDGSPLRTLLKASFEDSVDGLLDTLVKATALGWNPRVTAREMVNGYGVGLQRALNIARTEQLRVYREAARQQYQRSGVVSGYQRIATHDDRVCAACIMAEGTEYRLDESFEEHPSGRCSLVPIVTGFEPVTWLAGPDWFKTQDEATQRSILGGGAFDAWKDGAFDLPQLITRREDDTWGASLVPTSLQVLLGG